jgi:hypothetical protein
MIQDFTGQLNLKIYSLIKSFAFTEVTPIGGNIFRMEGTDRRNKFKTLGNINHRAGKVR